MILEPGMCLPSLPGFTRCDRCGASVRLGDETRKHPLYENADGGAHALTCAARVRSAVLVVKPEKKGSVSE